MPSDELLSRMQNTYKKGMLRNKGMRESAIHERCLGFVERESRVLVCHLTLVC
jgi:hypothetical protein